MCCLQTPQSHHVFFPQDFADTGLPVTGPAFITAGRLHSLDDVQELTPLIGLLGPARRRSGTTMTDADGKDDAVRVKVKAGALEK